MSNYLQQLSLKSRIFFQSVADFFILSPKIRKEVKLNSKEACRVFVEGIVWGCLIKWRKSAKHKIKHTKNSYTDRSARPNRKVC